MKNIFLIILILTSFQSYSQDSIVTNLNIRASVVNTIVTMLNLNDVNHLNAFIKFADTYRDGSEPIGASNVNIDTIYTSVLVFLYEKLRYDVLSQTAFTNFATDITSKRAVNADLDGGCDDIDIEFDAQVLNRASFGRKLLIGK